MKKYARRFDLRILVETGTARGDMLAAVRGSFERLHSVELDERLWKLAKERFARDEGIHLCHGDSEIELPAIVHELDKPALFWLDAHQMVGGARGRKVTPILEELGCILAHPMEGHVLLIDDARLFTGQAYPTPEDLASRVAEAWPDAVLTVQDDIIRIHLSTG